MKKIKTLKNSYFKMKENFSYIITEEKILNEYIIKLIEEAEENLKNDKKTITLEEWQKK